MIACAYVLPHNFQPREGDWECATRAPLETPSINQARTKDTSAVGDCRPVVLLALQRYKLLGENLRNRSMNNQVQDLVELKVSEVSHGVITYHVPRKAFETLLAKHLPIKT